MEKPRLWPCKPLQGLIFRTTLHNDHIFHDLGECTVILVVIRSDFELIQFLDETPPTIQNSSRWDATFCGITSRAMLFA